MAVFFSPVQYVPFEKIYVGLCIFSQSNDHAILQPIFNSAEKVPKINYNRYFSGKRHNQEKRNSFFSVFIEKDIYRRNIGYNLLAATGTGFSLLNSL